MTGRRIVVDWPACVASGRCYAAAPGLIRADEWGYPLLAPGELPAERVPDARAVVDACPRRALHIVETAPPPRSRRERRRGET